MRPYLVACGADGGKIRLYALQRFKKVEVTDKNVVPPKRFSIDSYISEGNLNFGVDGEIMLRARVSDDLASYLYETPLGRDQKISYRNGSYTVSTKVKDTWQLFFWILSQGASITVLSPKKLREKIAAELKSAFGNYKLCGKF